MNLTSLIQALINAFPILEKIISKLIGIYQRDRKIKTMVDYKKAEETAKTSDNTEDIQEIIGRKLK